MIPMEDSEEGVDWHADGEDVPRWLVVTWTGGIVALLLLGIGLVGAMAQAQ